VHFTVSGFKVVKNQILPSLNSTKTNVSLLDLSSQVVTKVKAGLKDFEVHRFKEGTP
jgi:hypothetical protein